MTFRSLGDFTLSDNWSRGLWECPECFAVVSDTERHAKACRAAAARRKAPCSLRAGMRLSDTCACGHIGYVHGRGNGTTGAAECSVCPPQT